MTVENAQENRPYNAPALPPEQERGYQNANSGLVTQKVAVNKMTPEFEGDQEEQEQSATPEPDKPYQRTNWKKRYDDIKRHYDEQLNAWKREREELETAVQEHRPVYQPPKDVEELKQWRAENPDLYQIVESVAHLRASDQVAAIEAKLKKLEEKEKEVGKRTALATLKSYHPDFEQIKESDDFQAWAEEQPRQIQQWLFELPDPELAAKAISMYKAERQAVRQKKPTSTDDQRVRTRSAIENEGGKAKVWTAREIEAMSLDDFEKYREEIDQAFVEGRVRR